AKFDSSLSAVKRPPIRPFAAYSAHDPDTNVFDLSQKGSGGQKDVYAENDWVQPRTISHIALRTRHAERCSQFYADVFGLAPLDRLKDGNFYLSDGRVTLMIIPWKITDYYAQDPARAGLDHIGFKVESVDQVKKDMEFLIGDVDPVPVGIGHLPFAARLTREKAFAHIGFRAAAERHAGEIGIHPGHFRDPRLERVQILDMKADMVRNRALDRHAPERRNRPGQDGERHAPVG